MKYYDCISEWIIDEDKEAPERFTWEEVKAMGDYSSLSNNGIEAIVLSFCSTGQLRLEQGGSHIRKLPFTSWDAPPPVQYYDFS